MLSADSFVREWFASCFRCLQLLCCSRQLWCADHFPSARWCAELRRVMANASRIRFIFSKRDPENSPEYSYRLHLYGNHWSWHACMQARSSLFRTLQSRGWSGWPASVPRRLRRLRPQTLPCSRWANRFWPSFPWSGRCEFHTRMPPRGVRLERRQLHTCMARSTPQHLHTA